MAQKKRSGWQDPAEQAALNNPFAALKKAAPTPPVEATEPPPVEPPAVEPMPAAAAPKRAVVRLERKGRGGKTATLITHLGLPPDQLAAWCAELRAKLGTGGAVEEDTLVLQGDQRDRVVKLLGERGVAKVTLG